MGGEPTAPRRLRDLRNLGPRSEQMLAEVGIDTPQDLEEVGAAAAYQRLRDAGVPGVTRTMLWALGGALLDVDWRDLPSELRDELDRQATGPS